jgi:hypothetical protein
MEKYLRAYDEIHEHITGLLEGDPQAEKIADRFRSWAEEWYIALFPSLHILTD